MFQKKFWDRKIFFMTGSKGFVPYFYNHNKKGYIISLSFLKINVFFLFKIVLEQC